MLSDFASFLISLFAIWVATRKPSKGMSFGWHRAGVYTHIACVQGEEGGREGDTDTGRRRRMR